MYGHFKKLDEEIKRRAASLEVEAQLSQVCNCRSLHIMELIYDKSRSCINYLLARTLTTIFEI
ncbi:hypothetical protein RchiOBHm_Chr7g0208621 [Rosa chinensis]|uniref:Uncharacterized protein n=1 Tax=Rosa chinensis TaxID=74649 RepID=A0A2P6P9T7_ROSCH|nr:hypothetical protein RchiOBHm_Chr7g0208621 [Rosa chinensis]